MWKQTHYVLSVAVKYNLYSSHSASLVFLLLLLLLTFVKDAAGISSAFKMQLFSFPGPRKSQLPALVLQKLTLARRSFCR